MPRLALGLLGLVLPVGAHAGVVINEFIPNPDGTDAGQEWIELYNSGEDPVDLDGWVVETGLSSPSPKLTFSGETLIGPGAYLVVGDPGVTFAHVNLASGTLGLGNATTSGDIVRLTDGAVVIDTVVYGPNNSDGFLDDTGAVATSFAPTPGSGASLARSPDGRDTDQSGSDFIVDATPTPGSANPAPPLCVGSDGLVLLNEVLPDPAGTDSEVLLEWVELHNAGLDPVFLDGWMIERASQAGAWSVAATFPPDTEIGGQGFLLLGEANVPGAHVVAPGTLGLYSGTGGDGVRLVDCTGLIVDTLLYGGANTDLLAEDDGVVPGTVAPRPSADVSIARVADGVDTDVSAVDWHLPPAATPGASNPAPPTCAPSTGDVVLNELLANPAGADATVLLEYVELYNRGGDAAELGGWRLEVATKGDAWGRVFTFLEGDAIAGLDFLVVGETNVVEADIVVDLLGLPSGAGGDGLRLVDCDGAVVDVVVYGDPGNADGIVDETGEVATSLAPKPGDDQAIARRADGHDTDDAGADFWITTGTPGSPNPTAPVCATGSGVVVNEVLVNPAGADSTAKAEFVELYNASTEPLSLDGWAIQVASSAASWSSKHTFDPDTVLEPGAFLLVGEANVAGVDVAVETLGLPNGTNGDGIRLVDCAGDPVDTLVYGGSNDDGIVDDSGLAATSVAPNPGDDQALARRVDGVDTDRSGDDFWIPPAATPGAPNPEPPLCVPSGGGVVINELLPDPPGADSTVLLEWVELYNASGSDALLSGWTLQFASSEADYRIKASFDEGVAIPAGGWLLVGEPNVAGADVVVDLLGLGSGAGGDGLRLVDCGGAVVDTVVYGGVNDQEVIDDSGDVATSVAPKPGAGQSVARRVDGVDTDRSGDDFYVPREVTPGAANPEPPVCVPSSGGLVINEFVANPAGADSTVLLEWIEVYNTSSEPQRLDGWTLAKASSADKYTTAAAMPDETWIGPGEYLLVGEPNVSGAHVVVDLLGLGSGAGGDGVRLLDCQGSVVDTVVYGGDNEDLVIDDSGEPATSFAPRPSDDQSVARKVNGVDTDLSGDDFTLSSAPTPGAPNPEIVCVPSTGAVLLNELLPDPAGSDGEVKREWVELFNTSSEPVSLDGWGLVFAGKPDVITPSVVLPPGTTIGGAGFFVVGDENVDEADLVMSLSIGNGSAGDALRLVDCTGAVVDVVIYGADNTDGHATEDGVVQEPPSRKPGADQSLARIDDGVDTNEAADWFVDATPTPGATNHTTVPDLPGVEPRGGCGGPNGQAPDAGAPTGGCSTVPGLPFGGLELLTVAGALLRRRR